MQKRFGSVISNKIFGWSLVVTPLLLYAGIISAGGGHGDYIIAKILFPYTFIYWCFSSEALPWPLILLGFFQYPSYGILFALAAKKNIIFRTGIIVLLVHCFAVCVCFGDEVVRFLLSF